MEREESKEGSKGYLFKPHFAKISTTFEIEILVA